MKIEITSSIFSSHNTMRLEINYKKKYKKHKHMEAKQCATKQTMGQWRKQNGNQKVSRGKWKQNKQTKNGKHEDQSGNKWNRDEENGVKE